MTNKYDKLLQENEVLGTNYLTIGNRLMKAKPIPYERKNVCKLKVVTSICTKIRRKIKKEGLTPNSENT